MPVINSWAPETVCLSQERLKGLTLSDGLFNRRHVWLANRCTQIVVALSRLISVLSLTACTLNYAVGSTDLKR